MYIATDLRLFFRCKLQPAEKCLINLMQCWRFRAVARGDTSAAAEVSAVHLAGTA